MHVPNLEGVTQAEDRDPTINLEDWTITFKEFQPKRSKQSKKQISKASQEKVELPQPLADRSVQPSSNQLQPEVVQPPYDNSIEKNPDAQAIPRRVEMEQKESRDGRVKRVVCFKYGEKGHYASRCSTKRGSQDEYAKRMCSVGSKEGHYANRCPTKRKKTRSRDPGLYCLKCGEDGHLASWCEKENDN